MSVNVKTNKDKNEVSEQMESAIPEVLLTPHHLVVSTLVRNVSFQVGDTLAPVAVRLIASMILLLNENINNMDEKLLNSWNNIPTNIIRLWISVLKNNVPYDVSMVAPTELFNLASVLMMNMTPIVLAHADTEPCTISYDQSSTVSIPAGVMEGVQNLADSIIPNELDSIIREVRSEMGPAVTSDEVMLEATKRVWGDRIDVTDTTEQEDTVAVTVDNSITETTPEEVVADYATNAQEVIAQAKIDEGLISVAAGTASITPSAYSGGGSSSDEWGAGSYLLLAAAVGAVAYGGYKLFSDGEAEDVTIADLDYTI